MELVQAKGKSRLRREKTREAVALALESRWEEAVAVNREILRLFPQEVEAWNRLGKALLELGRYTEARQAFEGSVSISPHNAIAKKNLERLAHLRGLGPIPKRGKKVTPYHFIEESGRSGVITLHNPAPRQVLAKVAAGDVVSLRVQDHNLVVENLQGEYLGRVEPKLAHRLIRLIKGGNLYEGAVTSVNEEEISVILLEVYRHPSLTGVCSFPSRGTAEYRAYLRDTLLRYDLESEEEEEEREELTPEWKEEGEDSLSYLEEASEEPESEAEEGEEP